MAVTTPTGAPRPPEVSPAPAEGKRGRISDSLWADFGEEFRSLRTKVAGVLHERHKVILVTSALPQEGKTTVSVNLARSFAQMEWRTILIDGDLRQPNVHELFGIERAPGLTDLLEGRIAEDAAIAVTDHAHLDVLPAGSRSARPAELIHSEATPRFMRGLAARYDYVVLDSPPLAAVTDAHLLAACVDGILLVVNGLVSPREMVTSACEQLQGRPVLGVVLNGISIPKKYGYYY